MAKRMNIIPGLEEVLRLKEEGIYSLNERPKGFPIALWKPSVGNK